MPHYALKIDLNVEWKNKESTKIRFFFPSISVEEEIETSQ